MIEKYFEICKSDLNVKCKLYCNDIRSVRNIIVSCHGFGGNKDNSPFRRLAMRVLGKKDDWAMITFDWPCHGQDARQKLCLADCDRYLSLVIDCVGSSFRPDALYANATSFGGYLTLKYIKEHGNPFQRISLRCPAVDMDHVLFDNILTEEDREQLRKGRDVLSGFERKVRITPALMEELNENRITEWDYREYADTILIVHGTEDELVSFDTVKRFADANSIGFAAVEGADHTFSDPARISRALDYLEGHLLSASIYS